jgi:hypothetical protein
MVLYRIAQLLRHPLTFAREAPSSRRRACAAPTLRSHDDWHASKTGGAEGGESTTGGGKGEVRGHVAPASRGGEPLSSTHTRYRSDVKSVLGIIWGMAVMRPRIRLAQFILRALPHVKDFNVHRRLARKLMPHWYPF